MRIILFVLAGFVLSGCCPTVRFRTVTVHKGPDGKIIDVEYIEGEQQNDSCRPVDGFGKYLYNQ